MQSSVFDPTHTNAQIDGITTQVIKKSKLGFLEGEPLLAPKHCGARACWSFVDQTIVFQKPEYNQVLYRRRAATPTIPARAPETLLADAAPVYYDSVSLYVAER